MLDEAIVKAVQTASLLASDLESAFNLATEQPLPPHGRSYSDNALISVLADRMTEARQLQAKLNQLCRASTRR